MADGAHPSVPEFEPLHPASRTQRIVVFVVGPLLWLALVLVVVVVVRRSKAIEVGLVIAGASVVLATAGLLMLWEARRREERRYVEDH